MAIATRNVFFDILQWTGSAANGRVLVYNDYYLSDSDAGEIIEPGLTIVTLVNGEATEPLRINNQTDVEPSGWSYRVIVETETWRKKGYIAVPAGDEPDPGDWTTLNFSDLFQLTTTGTSGGGGGGGTGGVTSVNGHTGVVVLTATDVGAVTSSRLISAGTGLSGGGSLAADRTISASFGSTAGTIAQGNDSRLSDARTPLAHAATHAEGGGDAVTLTQAQITGLVVALAAKLALAGGTMTGTLTLAGAPTLDLQAATKLYVDGLITALQNALTNDIQSIETLIVDSVIPEINLKPTTYVWDGDSYEPVVEVPGIYVGPTDPGVVPDGSLWFDTSA